MNRTKALPHPAKYADRFRSIRRNLRRPQGLAIKLRSYKLIEAKLKQPEHRRKLKSECGETAQHLNTARAKLSPSAQMEADTFRNPLRAIMANIEAAQAMPMIQKIRGLRTIWSKEFAEEFVQRLYKV